MATPAAVTVQEAAKPRSARTRIPSPRLRAFRTRYLPWAIAPLAMLVTFVIGLGATWAPPIPRLVTSSVGPTMGAIGEPVGLDIPSVGIKAAIVPIALEGEELNPPGDVKKVGWWTGSAEPGAENGQSLMTGHAVHTGGGVMNHLGDVNRGASVTVTSKDKSTSYIVQKVFVWSKAEVEKHSEDLFTPDYHQGRLVLVTCADWDGHVWESNVIVFAQPV